MLVKGIGITASLIKVARSGVVPPVFLPQLALHTLRYFLCKRGMLAYLSINWHLPAICLRMVIVGCGHCCADNQKLTTWPLSMPNTYTHHASECAAARA